jgi:hypothetical protein
MSGPTAGRLIAAEIGARFASFNMPNLHQRTTTAGLDSDFRPGVTLATDAAQGQIDIADEFERQFFGDLILFTTEALVQQADVQQPFSAQQIAPLLAQKETELMALYQQKQAVILANKRQLHESVFGGNPWWISAAHTSPPLALALQQVQRFIDNIDYNFGPQATAWQQIQSVEHRALRKQQIMQALQNYRAERNVWDGLFD